MLNHTVWHFLFKMLRGISYKSLVLRSVSNSHKHRTFGYCRLFNGGKNRRFYFIQFIKHKNYILFKFLASGLFLKYFQNFADFSLDILIKKILAIKGRH